MSGCSKVIFIGNAGGFMGSDGLAEDYIQVMVEDADRQALKLVHRTDSMKSLGSVKVIIPEGPNDPRSIVDAAIVFIPDLFRECPSFAAAAKIANTERLDFDRKQPPAAWQQLRREALPILQRLHVFQAELQPLDVSTILVG